MRTTVPRLPPLTPARPALCTLGAGVEEDGATAPRAARGPGRAAGPVATIPLCRGVAADTRSACDGRDPAPAALAVRRATRSR
eukprot:scaffold5150_cov376-Prasinococcus_capsulatus_cf.AAC.15